MRVIRRKLGELLLSFAREDELDDRFGDAALLERRHGLARLQVAAGHLKLGFFEEVVEGRQLGGERGELLDIVVGQLERLEARDDGERFEGRG